MKRIVLMIIICVLVTSFTGCDRNVISSDEGKVQIVTTVFPLYDIARQIAGDNAKVDLLLQPGAEAHSYEPTTQDVIKIKESDVFVYLGTEAEPWTNTLIKDEDLKAKNLLSAMECVEVLEEEHTHSHIHAHSQTNHDQHVWTSLKNVGKIASEITRVLCEYDAENAASYQKNSEKYLLQVAELDKRFENLTENKHDSLIVFADRFPFKYFVEEYGLDYFAAYPGCTSESEPSVADVSKLIDIVKERNISVVFYTETSNMNLPDAICAETGAQAKLFHSCHTVTDEQLRRGITYIEIMNENYKALEQALK